MCVHVCVRVCMCVYVCARVRATHTREVCMAGALWRHRDN